MNDNVLIELQNVIESRKNMNEDGSYTCYLFREGIDKILKKVGEECTETVIAAKNLKSQNMGKELLVGEVSDLLYHICVMLSDLDVSFESVLEELEKRSLKTNNKKTFKTVDKNT